MPADVSNPLVRSAVSVLSGFRAALFDVDGTLYKQKPLRMAMARRLLIHAASSPREGWETMRILRSYRNAQESMRSQDAQCGDLGDAQIRFACEQSGTNEIRVRRCVGFWIEEQPLPYLLRHRMPNLVEFLEELKKQGVKTAVCSDYPAAAKLKALGVEKYFDLVKAAQDADVQRFKPHPRILEAALAGIHVPADRAVYFGDRPEVDGAAARRAGIGFVAISPRSGFEPVLSMLQERPAHE